jgi:hypothetical protein
MQIVFAVGERFPICCGFPSQFLHKLPIVNLPVDNLGPLDFSEKTCYTLNEREELPVNDRKNELMDTCTSILTSMEKRTRLQRQLVESQRLVLDTLRACNAKMERLAHVRPGAKKDAQAPLDPTFENDVCRTTETDTYAEISTESRPAETRQTENRYHTEPQFFTSFQMEMEKLLTENPLIDNFDPERFRRQNSRIPVPYLVRIK